MAINFFVVGAVLLYFAILAVISYRASRNESNYEFATGDYNISTLGTFSSLFVSTIDGAGFVFLISLAGAFGFGLYWFVIAIILTATVLYVQTPRIKALVAKEKFLTLNDMLLSRIGKLTSTLALVMIIVIVAANAASLLHITGQIFQSLFGLNAGVWVVITAGVVGLYMYVGGYKTVIKTDIVQFFALLLMLVAAMFVSDIPSLTYAKESFMMGGDVRSIGGIILFFLLAFYTVPAIWQRIFTAQSTSTARKSLVLYGVTYIPVYFIIISFGLTLFALFPDVDPSTILYHLSSGVIDPILGVIISVSLLALTMSSIDTQAYVLLSTTASNLLHINKEQHPKKYYTALRSMIIFLFVTITVIALTIIDVIGFIIAILTLLSVLAPAIFFSVYSNGANTILDRSMFAVTIVGIIVYFYMLSQGLFTDFLMNAVPGFVAFGLGVIVWVSIGIYQRMSEA